MRIFFFFLGFCLPVSLTAQEFNEDSLLIYGKSLEIHDEDILVSNRASGGALYAAYGILDGNHSRYFSNPFMLGFDMDIHHANLLIQLEGLLGFNKVKQSMFFDNGFEWKENKFVLSVAGGVNVGYTMLDSKNFLAAPVAGLGVQLMTSTLFGENYNIENEPFLPYYKLGFIIDIKPAIFMDEHVRINNKDHYYTSLRIGFGLNMPLGNSIYNEYYHGSMVYFSIGMAALYREYFLR